MLASVNPLGERARNRRWGVTVSAYLVGSVAGAALVGLVAGVAGRGAKAALGSAWPATAAAVVVAACAAGLAFDLHLGGVALPTVHRQVEKDWLDRYRGWVYGLGFGFQLGLGVVTVVNTAAIYLAVVLALASGSAAGGLVVGTTFGLVRGLVILAAAGADRPDALRRVLARIQAWDGVSRRATIGVQALVGVVVAAAGLAR
ncbi:MAG: hypothetical protein ABR511_10905 [Acidimicrobiales bacterium]